MRNAIIRSTGAYAPERVLPNSFFNDLLGENVDAWLRENVEIYERRWCKADESTADLCEHAARQAIERAGLNAAQIDLLIIATDTPEYISPSTASVVQHRIGAVNAGTFDVNTACAGFVTAMDIGAKYILSDDQYQNVLVIGAYAMSKYLNIHDKKTVTLFADGAGAVVMSAEESNQKTGFLSSKLISKGQYCDWMGIYGGGTRYPINQQMVAENKHLLQFVKKFPKELNPEVWSGMTLTLCDRLGITPDEIDHFFITQINVNSLRETMDILGQPREKAYCAMHYLGYTGSACIPMAFHMAVEEGKVKPGQMTFFIGSGGGLAFAAAAVRMV
jgi:3-oxoacyl-[acyl-carrier-protein] synthase-3